MPLLGFSALFLVLCTISLGISKTSSNLSDKDGYNCPGYEIIGEVTTQRNFLAASLRLAGSPCNIHGRDIENLRLTVEYQTDFRLHVKIEDADSQVYQVQEEAFPRPRGLDITTPDSTLLNFTYTKSPFTFQVLRTMTGEVLFDTSCSTLIFETQYLHLRTLLPQHVNLYGLGEHSDDFRFPEANYKRSMWNSESPFLPTQSNLYGSHPVYFDHRSTGTHGVFLLNSNGLDVDFGKTDTGRYLEYNGIGGVLDLYFFTGPDPVTVSEQYALIAGLPAMTPYWALGFHQCKYGWPDLNHVKGVAYNYSAAGIPLETMWTDLDYMKDKRDFEPDPTRFPLEQYKAFVDTLHNNDQHYVVILDPGISHTSGYGPFDRGARQGAFLLADDGSFYLGRQWPGEVVWPDWFAPGVQSWWTNEIRLAFDPDHGIAVDGLWVDMNEASNMCSNVDCFPNATVVSPKSPQSPKTTHPPPPRSHQGLSDRNLFNASYHISNHVRDHFLSSGTIYTNISNYDGTHQYDTHNLYGHMMASATRSALLSLRPLLRPFVLTRSTFSGSGRVAAHWFGDNASTWEHYRTAIKQLLGFAAIHAMPMVGSDVCGFNLNASEKMCARWAMLGAFQPFYRNHADITASDQEFYRWPLVTQAAKKAIDARYRLLDYVYTAMRRASERGTPVASPLWFAWPRDEKTYAIQTQWLWGDALVVSPVVEDESTNVAFYLPNDVFYDFWTGEMVQGEEKEVTLTAVAWDEIPVHVRGGSIIPLRVRSGMTTAEVRKQNFEILVAPGIDGRAKGELYLDDGVSLDVGREYSLVELGWDGETFVANGTFTFDTELVVESVRVLGANGTRVMAGAWSLREGFSIEFLKY